MIRSSQNTRTLPLAVAALMLALGGSLLWSPGALANKGNEYVTRQGGGSACKNNRFRHGESSPPLRILGIPGLSTPVQLWGDGMDFADPQRIGVGGALRNALDVTLVKGHGGPENVVRGCDAMGSFDVRLGVDQLPADDLRGTVTLRFPAEPHGPYQLPVMVRPLIRAVDWDVPQTVGSCLGSLGGSLRSDGDGNLLAALPSTLLGALGNCLPEATLDLQLPSADYVDFLPSGIGRIGDLDLQTRLANNADAALVEILSGSTGAPRLRLKPEGLRALLPTLSTTRSVPIQIRAENRLVYSLNLKISQAASRIDRNIGDKLTGGLVGSLLGGGGGGTTGSGGDSVLPDLVPLLDGLLLQPGTNGRLDASVCQALAIPVRSTLPPGTGLVGSLLNTLLSQTTAVTVPALQFGARNAGTAPASAFTVQGFGDTPSPRVNALNPGQSRLFVGRAAQTAKLLNLTAGVAQQLGLGNQAGCFLPAGQSVDTDPQTVAVEADPANQIRESNETNNRLSR